jgi:hypothetical protein
MVKGSPCAREAVIKTNRTGIIKDPLKNLAKVDILVDFR